MAVNGIFVTGTDTNVGKTVTSSIVLSALRHSGIETGYFKPVQTGVDSDTETVSRLSQLGPNQVAKPVYQFPDPIAPFRAATRNQETIHVSAIVRVWESLGDRFWVVEGAGGLLVPLNPQETIRELVQAMKLDLVVISPTRLGTINHTLLTLEAAKSAGISVCGVILVGNEDPELDEFLMNQLSVRVLTRIPALSEITPESVSNVAREGIRPETVVRLTRSRIRNGGSDD